MLLPDINVWLALTFIADAHNVSAKAWFDGLGDELCYFCRMTQQGFLRLATNQSAFGIATLTQFQAWQVYDVLHSDPRVAFAEEPARTETLWRSLTQQPSYSTNVWNDAYLAAFASAGGLTVVTFDRGFSKFAGIKSVILS